MNKEFVTYNQALALKELGFNEDCFGYYVDNKLIQNGLNILNKDCDWVDNQCSSPLYQQVFRWFREKHNLFHNIWNYTHGEPTDLIPNGFTFSIDEDWVTIIGKKEDGYFEKYYTTYEEAESACLDKLIEIIKNK
jgi:hypothetical protein